MTQDTREFPRYIPLDQRELYQDTPVEFSEDYSQELKSKSHELSMNYLHELSGGVPQKKPRIIVGDYARYRDHFATEAYIISGGFSPILLDILDDTIEETVQAIIKRTGRKMRIVQIHYQTLLFYDNHERCVQFVGTVLMEPYKGLLSFFK